jgi:predicted transcriptional regulator
LVLLGSVARSARVAQAATTTTTHTVTATPPLQAVPAIPVSKSVQARMRACNATADGRKLQSAARETFIKSCMAPHRARPASRAGSQPKTDQ